jgi:hypothetical protein
MDASVILMLLFTTLLDPAPILGSILACRSREKRRNDPKEAVSNVRVEHSVPALGDPAQS